MKTVSMVEAVISVAVAVAVTTIFYDVKMRKLQKFIDGHSKVTLMATELPNGEVQREECHCLCDPTNVLFNVPRVSEIMKANPYMGAQAR